MSLEQPTVSHVLLCPGPVLHLVMCVRAEEPGSGATLTVLSAP